MCAILRVTTLLFLITLRLNIILVDASAASSENNIYHRSLLNDETLLPSYYDELRIQQNANATNQMNSSIYEITVVNNDDLNTTISTYRLVEIKSFIAFTTNKTEMIFGTQNEGYAVLLAMYHFNNMVSLQSHPVLQMMQQQQTPNIFDCNVRMTMELLDKTFSPTIATQTIATILERPSTLIEPMTTAVVSSSPTTVTLPLATFTGIYNVPIISATATSTGFDDKDQFPLFTRTITNADGIASSSLYYFKNVTQSTHVAILFVTDSFGSDLLKGFQEEAAKVGILTESIAFSRNVTDAEARSVFATLKSLQYYHVYAICYIDQLETLFTAAYDLHAIGPDYLYILPISADVHTLKHNLRIKDGTPYSKAIQGIGIVQISAGVSADSIAQGTQQTPIVNENPISGYERFRLAWKNSLQDLEFQSYVRSKLPDVLISDNTTSNMDEYFLQEPFGVHAFLYDAVTSLGVAMCSTNSSQRYFTGQDINERMRQLDIDGATGNVRMTGMGTRSYSTISFTLWNVQVQGVASDGMSILEFIPSHNLIAEKWDVVSGNDFVYADGTTIPPDPLPPVDHEYNHINQADRIFGYTLMCFALLSSILAIVWTILYRKSHVIDAAQPLFLIITFVGAFIMALTIIPAGLDETVVSSTNGLDAACMAVPWLYFIGSNLSSGALLAKTKAVYGAYVDPEIETLHVSSSAILKSVFYQVGVNFVLLLLWNLIAPLEWIRFLKDAKDNFDRELESYANCSASDESLVFAVIIILVNMGFLIVGTFWAYKSRNITTEYNESQFIGLCIVAVLQSWAIGLPILIVVRDNPSVSFYVQSSLIFVTSLSVVSFIFVPKIIAIRKEAADSKKNVYKEFKRAASLRQRALEESERDGSDNSSPSTLKPKGIKIIHNPRSQRNLQLSGGMELSMRQLQILEDAIAEGDREDSSSPGDGLVSRTSNGHRRSLATIEQEDNEDSSANMERSSNDQHKNIDGANTREKQSKNSSLGRDTSDSILFDPVFILDSISEPSPDDENVSRNVIKCEGTILTSAGAMHSSDHINDARIEASK